MGSERGAEPRSAEGLGVGWLSTTRERELIASRSVSSLSTFALTTSGSLAKKILAREPKRERSELTMKKKVGHGIEGDYMEAAEEATGATHIVADGLVRRLLEFVEGGDALKECILASGVVFIKDAAPNTEPVSFIHNFLEEYG